MKILINDENNIIIFLNKIICYDLDLNDKDDLEDYFKKLFQNLKNNYNLNLNGYLILDIYIDKIYGYIIEIIKEDLEYFDYFDNQVEMRIIINEDIEFLYKIDDILNLDKDLLKKVEIYKQKDNFYLSLRKNINNLELGQILEQSDIIYKNTDDIFNYGKLIKI